MANWEEAKHPRSKNGEFGWASKLSDRMAADTNEIGVGTAVRHQIHEQGLVHEVLPNGNFRIKFAAKSTTDNGMREVPGSSLKILNGGQRHEIIQPHGLPVEGAASRSVQSIAALNPSPKEVESVVAYTNGRDFYAIQDSLRHGDGSNLHIKNIDAVIARSAPLKKDIMVQREIGIQHQGVHNSTAEEIFGPVGSRVGQTFTDKGYTSTTTSNRFSWTDKHGWDGLTGGAGPVGKAAISIKIPKGTKTFKPDKHGKYIKEKEVLLPHGSKFKIIRDYMDFQGLRRIDMELLK